MDDKSLVQASLLMLLGAILILVGILLGVLVMDRAGQRPCCPVGGSTPWPKGVVMGVVFTDTNGNGQMDAGESGKSGEQVTLMVGTSHIGTSPQPSQSTPVGQYRIELVPQINNVELKAACMTVPAFHVNTVDPGTVTMNLPCP